MTTGAIPQQPMMSPMMSPTMYQSEPTTQFDQNIQQDLFNRIEAIREKINGKVDEISTIEANTYVDLIFYIIIVGIMCFFLYIVIYDLYRTLKFYYQQNEDSKRTSYRKSKSATVDDNEYQPEDVDNVNRNEYIQESLEKSNDILQSEMHDLKMFKKKNQMDYNTYASIDTKNINHINDNYEYDSKKNVTSFWNMIFQKPKYPSVTNNSAGGFFEFV